MASAHSSGFSTFVLYFGRNFSFILKSSVPAGSAPDILPVVMLIFRFDHLPCSHILKFLRQNSQIHSHRTAAIIAAAVYSDDGLLIIENGGC